jgi:Ser/Thr protein kinase RdoA (MazF antagonist)
VEAAAVLSGEAGPDGPRAALRPGALRSQVRAALTDLLDHPLALALGPCRLRRTKYKPGRRLNACFDVVIPGQAQRAVSATWRPAGTWPFDPPGQADAEEDARRRGIAAPFRSLSAVVPADDLRVDVWPLDAAFIGLVRLSDPTYAATVASLVAPPAVTPVRYRPGERHVLRYDVPESPGGGLFVKLYRDDRGAQTFRVGTAVAAHLEGRCRGRAPTPAAYLRDDRAVLVPVAKGLPLSVVLRQGRSSASTHLRDTGALLRVLHDAPASLMSLVGRREVGDELSATERATTTAQALVPGAATAVGAVVDTTRQLLARLPDEAPAFTHGDFKADNLIASRAGVSVVDLDRCACADPALDLAKFLADLRWWTGDRPPAEVASAQDEFLAGYGAVNGHGRVARARALEPLLIVKQAARRIPVHEPAWAARMSTSLAHAQALLEGLLRG